MEDIMKSLKGKFDENTLKNIANELGEHLDKVRPAVESIIHKVTAGLGEKFSQGGALDNVKGFLDRDGDGDVDLDDITGLFKGGGIDVQGMVKDLFGGDKDAFAASVSQDSGVSEKSAHTLIDKITAVAMEAIRKFKQESGFDMDRIIAMISGGGAEGGAGSQSIIAKILNFIKSLFSSGSQTTTK